MLDDELPDESTPLPGPAATAAALGIGAASAALVALVPGLGWTAAVATGVLTMLMALITLSDFRHYLIPDVFSLPAIPLGALANIAVFHGDDRLGGLSESAWGAVLAGGAFFLLRAIYFRLRGIEGLGLGDVKLAAAAGAWLGPALLAPACMVAALAGLAAAGAMALLPGRRVRATDQLPFGCFIAPVILLFWLMRLMDLVPFWQ